VILREIPEQTFQDELTSLEALSLGPNLKLFSLGAVATLKWLLQGKASPSDLLKGGSPWELR
jgi:hypothetical protein